VQLSYDISTVIGLDQPFPGSALTMEVPDLEVLLDDLRKYDGQIKDPSLERPVLSPLNVKLYFPHKKEMSRYIEGAFGVRIPGSSIVSLTAYEKIADWLESQSK